MSFNFSKLGDMFRQIGQKTLQTGVFFATTKAINSPCNMNSSVFGCGSFGGCGGVSYCGGYGFGMSGMNYGGGMGGYDMYSQLGMMDPYSSQMAIGQAYGQGMALGEYLKSQPPLFEGTRLYSGLDGQKGLKATGNKAAEKFTDHSPDLGEIFESHIQEGKDTNFVLSDWKKMAEGKEKDEQYKTYTSNFAKSYITYMDKTSGNEDNEITQAEFLKYNEEVDLKEGATDADKADFKQKTQTAFKKMDQNGDGKLDWKEMAAMFSTYDALKDGKHDGTITVDEFQNGLSQLTNGNSTNIDAKFRTEYTRLFGTDKKEKEE